MSTIDVKETGFKYTDEVKNNIKRLRSDTYNYTYNLNSGFFMRWGKDITDDPFMSPIGPEIMDIEVSTICNGINGTPCAWCYKSNTNEGKNMSLESFIKIVDIVNPYNNLGQIALGIGDLDANKDLIPMLKYSREHNIVPNITVNGSRLDKVFENKTYAEWIAQYCGAVAVSHYDDDICFNAVKKFTDLGMHQVNIHKIISEETTNSCLNLLKLKADKKDNRLDRLNAIVFLSLKNKGKRNTLHPLTDISKYKEIIDFAIDNKIRIGFDSCGANKFIEAVADKKDYEIYKTLAEPCESALFSFYVNVDGIHYPCSFCENEKNDKLDWTNGINLFKINNFMNDVWYSDKLNNFRDNLKRTCRNCPMFEI